MSSSTFAKFVVVALFLSALVQSEQQCTRANYVDIMIAHRAAFNAAEWFGFRSTHAAGAQLMIGAKVESYNQSKVSTTKKCADPPSSHHRELRCCVTL